MNQNIFCSKCHRIPSQCCCSSAKELTDEEIGEFTHQMVLCCQVHPSSADINVLGLAQIVKDILKKAREK
jgi:hypothetical protein